MPIPRLRPERSALLVIDLQEKLLPIIVDRHQVVNNAAVLLRMADVLEMPYLVSEHYPAGLGRTVEPVVEAMSDRSRRVEKTRFSALVDVVEERLQGWGRDTVIVCGIEAQICVLQTVLDLHATGRQCFVCLDAISASQREQIRPACDRMSRAGAVLTGVISTMYELLGDARHPAFRSCLELARAIQQ
jgi:nicotinamidase-related amidase